MQFVINTSLEPFGCAIVDDGQVVAASLWDDFRRAGEQTYAFLAQHKALWDQLDHIGGISGPGGFANLRVAGVILNALSLKRDLPVHQVRADRVVDALLSDQKIQAPFLLNSFGQSVFDIQGDQLIRMELSEAVKKYDGTDICVDFLPSKKQSEFVQKITVSKEDLFPLVARILSESQPQKTFMPDYEYPAVQA